MTLPLTETIDCPLCGAAIPFSSYQSVNVTNDPELKDRLLQRQLNRYRCRNCGREGEVIHDCLYHDMKSKTLIWLKLPDDGMNLAIDSSANVFIGLTEDYRFRLVGSLDELIEKVKIFDDGYDDITMAIFTFMISVGKHIDTTKRLFYYRTRNPFIGKKQIEFVEVNSDGLHFYRYPLQPIFTNAATFGPQIRQYITRRGHWLHVNPSVITKALEQAGLIRRVLLETDSLE